MKEATGELSTTVIAIVAIAAIAGLFTVFLLPMLRANIVLGQACGNGVGYAQDSCVDEACTKGYKVTCDKNKNEEGTWECHFTKDGKTTDKTCKEKDE